MTKENKPTENWRTVSERWGRVDKVLGIKSLSEVIEKNQERLEQEIENTAWSKMQTNSEKETIKVIEYVSLALQQNQLP